jgi:rSAM/selenodomain-associated transferase 1
MLENLLILFLKYPEANWVKTRLGKEIGYTEAARLYEKMVLQQISDLTCKGYELALYVDDRHDISSYKEKFGGDGRYFYQKGEDLGERMAHAMKESFQLGYARVILMGSDVPLVDVSAVNHFFDHLLTAEMVIGPSTDGGYYMIGFRNTIDISPVFKDIAWSTGTVFENTMAKAANLKVQVEKVWFDVDTPADLGVYQHLLETGNTFFEVDITSYYPVFPKKCLNPLSSEK